MKTKAIFLLCLICAMPACAGSQFIMSNQIGCDWVVPEGFESLNTKKNNHFWRTKKDLVQSILAKEKEFDFSKLSKNKLYLNPVVEDISDYRVAFFYFHNPEIVEASAPMHLISGVGGHILLTNFETEEVHDFLSSCKRIDDVGVNTFLRKIEEATTKRVSID